MAESGIPKDTPTPKDPIAVARDRVNNLSPDQERLGGEFRRSQTRARLDARNYANHQLAAVIRSPRTSTAEKERFRAESIACYDSADLFVPELTPVSIRVPNQPYPESTVLINSLRGGNVGPRVTSDKSGGIWILPQSDNGFYSDIKSSGGRPWPLEVDAQNLGGGSDNSTSGLSRVTFYPAIRHDIVEVRGDGQEERYSMYVVGGTYKENGEMHGTDFSKLPTPDRSGVIIKCASGDATFYPFNTLRQGSGMIGGKLRKPVIYFYPKKKTKILVSLDYKGDIVEEYPKSTFGKWDITAFPDSTFTYQGKRYKYLFWEGNPAEAPESEFDNGFCVNKFEVEEFLEEKLTLLGLNFAEKNDFITYWAPILKNNDWSVIHFDEKYHQETAKMTIFPRPDSLIRICMLFKRVRNSIALKPQKLKSPIRKGFVVLEWGGINLDEIEKYDFKLNGRRLNVFSQKSSTFI